MQEAKYIRIIAELRREILEGKYDSSGVFPSEMQLVRRFGASRKTVQRAIDELKRGNYIVRRRGSGTRVSHEARNASGKIGLIVPGMAHEEIFPSICQELVRDQIALGVGDTLPGFVELPHGQILGKSLRLKLAFLPHSAVVYHESRLRAVAYDIAVHICKQFPLKNVGVFLRLICGRRLNQ